MYTRMRTYKRGGAATGVGVNRRPWMRMGWCALWGQRHNIAFCEMVTEYFSDLLGKKDHNDQGGQAIHR